MFGKSKRSVALLVGAGGFTLLLGVAVASAVVLQGGSAGGSDEAALSGPGFAAAAEAETPVAVAEVAQATEAPPEVLPPVTAPAPAVVPETVKATAATVAEPAPEVAPAPAPAPASPASTAVPRLNPTSFQVFQAIQQLAVRIPLFKPTEAQARQFGDMVCTAFDQGQSYTEVKAAVLAAVTQVPGITVSSADADFAIRTAVELFCPGHKPKLA